MEYKETLAGRLHATVDELLENHAIEAWCVKCIDLRIVSHPQDYETRYSGEVEIRCAGRRPVHLSVLPMIKPGQEIPPLTEQEFIDHAVECIRYQLRGL